MSNTQVGGVYQKIIEEVINGCVVTFEEEGVDKRLLEEVKTTWQEKLTERSVALMPWEPAPNLPPQQQAQAPGSAAVSRQPQPVPSSAPQQSSGPSPMQATPSQNANNGVQIKSEPVAGYDLQNLPPPPNNVSALERARGLVQEKKDKIAANQSPQLKQVPNAQQLSTEQMRAYRQHVAEGSATMRAQIQADQRRQQQQLKSVGNAQTDGADDWMSMVAERRAAAMEGGDQADVSIRQRIETLSHTMEGGGLMLPLSEVQKRRKTQSSMTELVGAQLELEGASRSQMDGPGDSDDEKTHIKSDEDEDAINSDLDDSDDDHPEETEEDANNGEFMLCTYDKVQRVKNKWKCTLKDGVLATGGKEYVFHKAQGEFEW